MLSDFCRGSRRIAARTSLALAFALGLPLSAEALALRTYVASTGSDANTATNCAESAPCQTFAGAYSVTGGGGEIVALDSAGYGPLTITNSVTIIGVNRAFVKPTPGTTGITINAGKVTLENIEINGAGAASTTGIALNGGTLILKNSVLTQLATGLSVSSTKADVINSDITNNTLGVSTTGTGVDIGGGFVPLTGGPTEVRFTGGSVVGNTTAFKMNSPGTSATNGTNNVTILLWIASSASGGLTTYLAGNSTLMTGTGIECAGAECRSFAVFFAGQSGNLQ